jgi:formate hydrogenlyase subunit 4
MIHEVMVLDNSGPGLAFVIYGNCLKMFLIASLIASAVVPLGIPAGAEILFFIGTVVLVSVLTGVVESVMARLRMTHVPQLLFMIPAVSMVVFFVVIMGIKKLL